MTSDYELGFAAGVALAKGGALADVPSGRSRDYRVGFQHGLDAERSAIVREAEREREVFRDLTLPWEEGLMNPKVEAFVREVIEKLGGKVISSHPLPAADAVVGALKDLEAGRAPDENIAIYAAALFGGLERYGFPTHRIKSIRTVVRMLQQRTVTPVEIDSERKH